MIFGIQITKAFTSITFGGNYMFTLWYDKYGIRVHYSNLKEEEV